MNEESNSELNEDVFSMESSEHSGIEILEQRLQQALQELKLSQEERSHLLLALERASQEQDVLDEELEQKDKLLQQKNQELEDVKRLLSETQQMWMQERQQIQEMADHSNRQEESNQAKESAAITEIQTSSLYQLLKEHHQKSNVRWSKMEEHITKASGRLLSLQQRFSQLKQPLDGVLKVMQKVQLQGRKIVDGQSNILLGKNSDEDES